MDKKELIKIYKVDIRRISEIAKQRSLNREYLKPVQWTEKELKELWAEQKSDNGDKRSGSEDNNKELR